MHGEIISFYVEHDGQYIVMTVTNPDEGTHQTIRASRMQLASMAEAGPLYPGAAPLQTPTPHDPED